MLQENETRLFRSLVDNTPDGIFVIDPQTGRLLDVNQSACDSLRYTREELLTMGVSDLNESWTPEKMAEVWQRRDHGDIVTLGTVNRRKDGTVIPVEVHVGMLEYGGRRVLLALVRDITEHKRMEKALWESQVWLRELVDLLPAAVYVCDTSGVIQYYNRRAVELWGREPGGSDTDDRFCGSLKLYHPDGTFLPHYETPMVELLRTGIPVRNQEVVIEQPNGSRITVMVNIAPITNEQGKLIGAVNCFLDITDRKRAEDALRESEDRLRLIIEAIPQQIWSGQPDGSIEYCNDRWRSYMGLRQEELQGEGWQSMLHPDDRERVLKAWRESVVNGIPYEQEERHRGADGQYRWFLARGVPLRDAQGRIVRWYGTNTDIEDRKRAEEALRNSEERYRALYNDNPSMYFTVDTEGKILSVNQFGAEQLGYSVKELVGQSVLNVFYEDDKNAVLEQLTACIQNPTQIARWEFRKVRKGGSILWVKESARVVQGIDSNTIVLIVCEDITERKMAEKQLRESFAQLSKKNRYETIISTVTRSVHKSINLQEVLENAVEAMSKNIEEADSVSIFLIEGQEAILKVNRGFPDWFIERMRRIPYPKGATWKTIIEEKPIYCVDVDQDTVIGPAGREMGIKSYLITPIRYEGKTIGTLNINSLQKNAFDEGELKLLEVVAQQSEIAINKAQQAEALRKALFEVEQLKNRLQAENVYLQEEIRIEHNFEEIVGESAALKNVLRNVERVALTETTVLIQGETGTGKELIARAIHNLSPRRERPLIKVNCGAIATGLVESELFGHEKGAFTGAVQQRIGRFELADGGIIFLDEVAELPLDTQVKLLRVLQDGEFERVGGAHTIKVDVRVIAATNRDLKNAMDEGKFRSDLYYRLNVFPILIPPLWERKEDIPLLVRHFAQKYSAKLGKKIETIPQGTMDALKVYSWPGNVRELENMIERAVILSQGSTLQIDDSLDMRLDGGLQTTGSGTLEDVERAYILSVLEKTNWVIHGKRGAASVLGLNPFTLRSRMKKLGIKRPERST